MNIPQMLSNGDGRVHWLKIAAAGWLLLVSAIAIVNSVGLARLIEQHRANVQDAHVQALTTRVGDLEQQAEAARHQPKPIAQPDLDAARQALEERLSRIEQAQAEPRGDDVQALQARMAAIEARLKAPPSPARPRKMVEAPKPKVPEPPFDVVGLELRGGERFLSITAPGATALAGARLLREGDTVGAWQLQAIEARTAVFRVDGQTLRIAVP